MITLFYQPLKCKKYLSLPTIGNPPDGPGVQRWIKFVKYLRKFDIEPIVFIPENAHYPIIDKHIADDLPNDIQIIKQPIWEPYWLASLFSKKKTRKISSGLIPKKKISPLEKIMLWVRGNIFIPDARKFWIRPSVKTLTKFIEQNQIGTIITTSPPHSVQLIGYHLKKKIPQLRWLADFRDPWTSIGYHSELRLTKKSDRKHKMWESKVLQSADEIITTSFTTKREFELLTPKPIHVITNGYDTQENSIKKPDDTFLISHIGSLLTDRNPKILWEILSELVAENKNFANQFQLCLAGKISPDVIEDIKKHQLSNYLINKGYIPHKESVELQQKSQILLLLEIDSIKTQGIIPGKLFEYMIAGRPILGIGPKSWDATKIITETNTGKTFTYREKKL